MCSKTHEFSEICQVNSLSYFIVHLVAKLLRKIYIIWVNSFNFIQVKNHKRSKRHRSQNTDKNRFQYELGCIYNRMLGLVLFKSCYSILTGCNSESKQWHPADYPAALTTQTITGNRPIKPQKRQSRI